MRIQDAQRPQILVIDDNPVDSLVAQRVLESFGCDVVVCRGVWDAASYLECHVVDVVVTDRQLERGSFHELHNMMTSFGRKSPPYKRVVAVSGGWDHAERSAFYRYGELVSSFVTKGERAGPHMDCVVSEHVLAAAVRGALEELGFIKSGA